MKLIIMWTLVTSVSLLYGSQPHHNIQSLRSSFLTDSYTQESLPSYQSLSLYNDEYDYRNSPRTWAEESFAQRSLSKVSNKRLYPENLNERYYTTKNSESKSKRDICCCMCTTVSGTTILAIIGYLIFD